MMSKDDADALSVKQLLSRIRERVSHPATVRELMQALRLPRTADSSSGAARPATFPLVRRFEKRRQLLLRLHLHL